MKKASIILVGDELLDGSRTDENGPFIETQLTDAGFDVISLIIVPDRIESMISSFERSLKECDLTLVAGGLGPTPDDLTRKAASVFFGKKLLKYDAAQAHIESIFKKRNVNMPPENDIQSMIPDKSRIWINPSGTACPFECIKDGRSFIFLPGVHVEVREIFNCCLSEYLAEISKETKKKRFLVRTFGVSESAVYGILSKNKHLFEKAKISFLPQIPGVDVKIEETENCECPVEIRNEIIESLKDWVWCSGDKTIQEVIASFLNSLNMTISVAESCTGGYISNMLTDVPGSSDYFKFSAVTYSDNSKVRILGIEKEMLALKGSVSRETAVSMAQRIREIGGTDLGLSSTGIAGPGGGSIEKPLGLFFTGISSKKKFAAERFLGFEDRIKNKRWFSFFALDFLRRHLIGEFGLKMEDSIFD